MAWDAWKWEKMVVLRPAAEFASLVVLLCISRGCQFQATEKATIGGRRGIIRILIVMIPVVFASMIYDSYKNSDS